MHELLHHVHRHITAHHSLLLSLLLLLLLLLLLSLLSLLLLLLLLLPHNILPPHILVHSRHITHPHPIHRPRILLQCPSHLQPTHSHRTSTTLGPILLSEARSPACLLKHSLLHLLLLRMLHRALLHPIHDPLQLVLLFFRRRSLYFRPERSRNAALHLLDHSRCDAWHMLQKTGLRLRLLLRLMRRLLVRLWNLLRLRLTTAMLLLLLLQPLLRLSLQEMRHLVLERQGLLHLRRLLELLHLLRGLGLVEC